MRHIIQIFLLFHFVSSYSQEVGTYQNDSIYKQNHVTSRMHYIGNNKKLNATTYYNKNGQLIKFEQAALAGGSQTTTYYEYDQHGTISFQIDTIKNGKPDKKALKKMKKFGLNIQPILDENKNKPPLEVAKVDLEYQEGNLKSISSYEPDGTIKYSIHLANEGLKESKKWYRNGTIYRQDTTEFKTKYLKQLYYGYQEDQNGHKLTWRYTFKYEFRNNQVIKMIRLSNGKEQESRNYSYDKNGLLTKTDSNRYPEFFEYEYYE